MRYALVGPGDVVITLSDHIDPTAQTKTGYKWKQCDPVAQPSFDGLSETVTGPTYIVGETSVTEVWTKRNLTAQEISDAKDAALQDINHSLYATLAKILLNHENRIRTLESKATITMAQFKTGVKALL